MRVRSPLIARRYGVGLLPSPMRGISPTPGIPRTFLLVLLVSVANTSAFQADVTGSNPVEHSMGQPLSPLQVSFAGPHFAAIVQLAKTPPSQGGDHRFDPGWQYGDGGISPSPLPDTKVESSRPWPARFNGRVSGCGAEVARLLWEQDVVGSIPTSPTLPPSSIGEDVSLSS